MLESSDLIHIVYHDKCPDGIAGALLVARWANRQGWPFKMAPATYGDPMPIIPQDSDVVMVDFSFQRGTMDVLAKVTRSLVVLDHHKTALGEIKESVLPIYPFGTVFDQDSLPAHYAVLDMDHSGAVIAESWSRQEGVYPQVPYIEDRDLWRMKLPHSREVSSAARALPHDDLLAWVEFLSRDPLDPDVLSAGRAVLGYQEQMIKSAVERAFSAVIDGHIVWCTHTDPTIRSDVAGALAEKNPDAPFAAYILEGNDYCSIGLRSRGDFDVSVVAERYGGGGHASAAAFEVPHSALRRIKYEDGLVIRVLTAEEVPEIEVDPSDPILDQIALQYDLRALYRHALELLARGDESMVWALDNDALREWHANGRPMPWVPLDPEIEVVKRGL